METFHFIWDLLAMHGVIPSRKQEAEQLWNTLNIEQQRKTYQIIRDKLRAGKFVNYDPVIAIKNNAPKPPRYKILSYADYTRIYGTDADKDGWKRVHLPKEQKTIYVKPLNY